MALLSEEIQRKMAKILAMADELTGFEEDDAPHLRSKIKNSRTVTSDNAKFFKDKKENKNGENKVFLQRYERAIYAFTTQLVRVLSDKKYIIPRTGVLNRYDGLKLLTKWKNERGKNFQNAFEIPMIPQKIFNERIANLKKDRDFFNGYARLCGVMHVFGEHDCSMFNLFKSEKKEKGKPLKIDNSFVINGIFSDNDHERIYGSAQSADFFKMVLANEGLFQDKTSVAFLKEYNELSNIMDKDFEKKASKIKIHTTSEKEIEEAIKKLKEENDKDWIREVNTLFKKHYQKNIGDSLLPQIKENIAKPQNQHLKEYFVSFMEGVSDAIDLANDAFVEKLGDKYKEKFGELSGEVETCKKFLKKNAEQAKKDFAQCLDYFRELKDKTGEIAVGGKEKRKLPKTPDGLDLSSLNLPESEEVTDTPFNSPKSPQSSVSSSSSQSPDYNFTKVTSL